MPPFVVCPTAETIRTAQSSHEKESRRKKSFTAASIGKFLQSPVFHIRKPILRNRNPTLRRSSIKPLSKLPHKGVACEFMVIHMPILSTGQRSRNDLTSRRSVVGFVQLLQS